MTSERDRRPMPLLRGVVIAIWAFAAVAAALCFVPSVEVYRGASEGAAQYVGLRPPVDHPVGYALFFVGLALPGLLVYRRPRMAYALGWSALAYAASFVLLVVTFEIPSVFERRVFLPLAQVYSASVSAYLIVLMAGIPLGCFGLAIGRAIVRRRQRPPKPEFPRARVVPR